MQAFGPEEAPESTLDKILDKIESIFKRQAPTVESFGPEGNPPSTESALDEILDKVESFFKRDVE